MTIPNNAFLPIEFDLPKDQPSMHMRIEHRERQTASMLNVREIGIYEKYQVQNGQQWFSTQTAGIQQSKRQAFRTTFDLVALNGAPIGPGVTTLTLTATTEPPLINFGNVLIPTAGWGAATTATNFYFINDPLLFVRTNNMTPTTQNIIITNNTGAALSQAYWVFEQIPQ